MAKPNREWPVLSEPVHHFSYLAQIFLPCCMTEYILLTIWFYIFYFSYENAYVFVYVYITYVYS